MTYDRIKLDDMQLLEVLYAARQNRALVCVHAENHAMISWAPKRLLAKAIGRRAVVAAPTGRPYSGQQGMSRMRPS